MSYFLPYIKPAIIGRLLADTAAGSGLTTLLGTTSAVFWDVVPPEQTRPYVVCYWARPIEPTDALRTRRRQCFVSVEIVDDKKPDDEHDPTLRTAKCIDRIEGNWDEVAAGTAPTYGLDRWQPTLSGSTWTCDVMQLSQIEDTSDDETYRYGVQFVVTAQKVGA